MLREFREETYEKKYQSPRNTDKTNQDGTVFLDAANNKLYSLKGREEIIQNYREHFKSVPKNQMSKKLLDKLQEA